MTSYQDPEIQGGPGDPGGGGTPLPSVYARLSPSSQTVAAGGVVTLVPDFAGGAGVLNPGGLAVTSGLAVTLTVTATTTYTLNVGAGLATASSVITVGGIPSAVTRYLDMRWTYTEPTPVGACVGFELAFYIGTNPDDSTTLVKPYQTVPAADRRWVGSLSMIPPKTVSCAVRAIYSTGKSAWSVIAAGVPFT